MSERDRYRQICPDDNDSKEGSFDWILCQYLKGVMGADKYFTEIEPNLNGYVLSLDFHELFSYMYTTKREGEFNLINYMFDKNLKRGFIKNLDFTLLPPMVFELLQHFNYIKNKSGTYMHKKKATHSKEFIKLMQITDKLNLEKGKELSETEDFKFIINYWNKNYTKLTNLDILGLIGTEFGSQRFINEPHRRLEELFQENVIRGLNEIDITKYSVNQIGIEKDIFETCQEEFFIRRYPQGYNNNNNFNDSVHAAMAMNINKLISNNQGLNILDIYTGSPITLNILEHKLRFDGFNKMKHHTFVKCHLYLTSLLFCANELTNSSVNVNDFLNSCINSLIDIKKMGPDLSQEKISMIVEGDYCNKTLSNMRFLDIFYFNEKFYRFLEEAIKLNYFYDQLDTLTKMQQVLGNVTKGSDFLKIKLIKEYSLEYSKQDKSLDDNLAKTNEQIFKNSRKVYNYCIDNLKEYDYSKLTPQMKIMYEQTTSLE